jgi:hypothetical protein
MGGAWLLIRVHFVKIQANCTRIKYEQISGAAGKPEESGGGESQDPG